MTKKQRALEIIERLKETETELDEMQEKTV